MRIPLKAWFFRSPIDLKRLAARFDDCKLVDSGALVIDFDRGRRACVCDFGGVVFWPFDPELAGRVGREIETLLANPERVEEVEDRLVIETSRGETKVLFNEVWLAGEPDRDAVQVVSQVLAQSVALEYLEIEVDAVLARFGSKLDDLRERGRVRLSARRILKDIGFAMQTRQTVLGRLALFDKPAVTWESEELDELYLRLYDYFELDDRQRSLSLKLDFLADNTSLLLDFLSTRKSLRLEWAIVLLIVLEIVFIVIYDLSR